MRLLLGLGLSALIGYLGYRRRSLSRSGVLGAILVGTTVFGLGGWAWGVLLVAFFVSSSALSHFKESAKEALAEKFSKGGRRDLAQALANGGAGLLCAVANFVWPHPAWWAAFVGAMATVNADTWATEIGVLSKARPRLVTSGRVVEVGTSGGVTAAGTLAAFAGAGLIGLVAAGLGIVNRQPLLLSSYLLALSSLAGLLGSLFDSLLGATVQAIYLCGRCGRETERHPTHTPAPGARAQVCGGPTRLRRGWRWLDNDGVNFASSVAGAAVMGGVWLMLG
jgi:uncharacterized protein (TIGR00297 family)